jgi:hypothetical protein
MSRLDALIKSAHDEPEGIWQMASVRGAESDLFRIQTSR